MDSLVDINYIYDSTVDKSSLDANRLLIKQKNLTPVNDTQRSGSGYSGGKIIIDANSFGNSSDYIDWANAYITLPYRVSVEDTVAGDMGTVASANLEPSLLVALKNNSLIESVRVEQNGRVIINETANLSHLINFVQHCTTTQDGVNTDTRPNAYYPDDFNQSSFFTAGIAGVNNVKQSNPAVGATALGVNLNVNTGMLKRQYALFPPEDTTLTTDAQKRLELISRQNVPAFPKRGTAGTITLCDIQFIAVIYLRDLADYFKKHPISKGCSYKITLTINQATTTFTTTSSTTTPFSTLPAISTSLAGSGSTVQPALLCAGPDTANASATWGTATTHTLRLLSRVDQTYTVIGTDGATSTIDALQNGVIMYVPSYILSEEYESKLLSSPVITRNPYQVNGMTLTNLTANAPINAQLYGAVSNPRALIIIPQYSQDSSAQTQPSQMSPYNPSPAVSDPFLSLTRLQIRVNSKPILPAPISYGFDAFINNTSRIFKLNGGQTELTSGQIDYKKFVQNYRYYAFDLDLLDASQRDIPQLISLEAFNNSNVKIDLYIFCLYETTANFDLLRGSVDVM
jgi:hypothetical protein